MRILGIDPGYERLGIAVLEKNNGDKREKVVFSECFKTSSKLPFPDRLTEVGIRIEEIILEHQPKILSIETLFLNKNQKTAMKVSETRGAIIYSAKRNGLSVKEFTPLQIKIAITSDGRADKKQIIYMIEKLVKIEKEIEHDDEYDAIASALTCFATLRNLNKYS